MKKYKNLYLWMIVPMVLMQLGIFKDYWGDFTENAWSVHVHYWTGTIWYFYLIIQPYFATHGKMNLHRTNGIIGMFLAGGVCLTAFSMLHRDLANAQNALEMSERFGPFKSWFFYGVASVEIPMILSFGFAVIKGILNRKRLEDHAWWLISTVFLIMMPAMGRGIQNVYVAMKIKNWPNIDIMAPIYLTQVIIIALALLFAWKYKKLKHPATYLILIVNIYTCFLAPIGKSQAVQTFLDSVIKG